MNNNRQTETLNEVRRAKRGLYLALGSLRRHEAERRFPTEIEALEDVEAVLNGIITLADATYLNEPAKYLKPKAPSRPKATTTRKARPTNGLTLRASILAALANEGRPVEVKDIMPKLTGFAKQSVYAEITRLSKDGMIEHPATGIGWALTPRNEQPAGEREAAS